MILHRGVSRAVCSNLRQVLMGMRKQISSMVSDQMEHSKVQVYCFSNQFINGMKVVVMQASTRAADKRPYSASRDASRASPDSDCHAKNSRISSRYRVQKKCPHLSFLPIFSGFPRNGPPKPLRGGSRVAELINPFFAPESFFVILLDGMYHKAADRPL